MSKDIMDGSRPNPQRPRASGGGQQHPRDVMDYAPPCGPTNINDAQSPGLHGHNCGNAGTQGHHSHDRETSGSPGLHGSNHGMGTNRRG